MTVMVEKRDIDTVVVHGSLAGLLAGLVLGMTTVIASLVLTGSASWPFRFAASFVAGPDALDPALSLGRRPPARQRDPFRAGRCLRGGVRRPACPDLPALGPVVVTDPLRLDLRLRDLGDQLPRRRADVLPVSRRDGSTSPLSCGTASSPTSFIYGPVLGAYVIVVRPGVIDDWRAVGPPAGYVRSARPRRTATDVEHLDLGFPLWVRLTHFFNILFLSLLIRSGIEILGGHPMLYWNDHSTPGSEWVRFTRKRMPADELWTAEDEKQPYSPLVALPGRDHLGLGRYWHFAALAGWILTGAVYVLLLFASPQWQRLVPTSLEIFPKAAEAALAYFQLQSPPAGDPYNALQQLAYFGVIFVLSPLQIATGLAMSPAVAGRFAWYPRLFGGRQAARSIHFLGLVAFIVFIVHHTALVIADGLTKGLSRIVLGVSGEPTPEEGAVAVGDGHPGDSGDRGHKHLGHPRVTRRPP